MSYKAGNRFKEDTYFLTEVETDGTSAKVTGQLNGEEVDFESGGAVTVEPLSVTENGEYEALEGSAYNPVTVEVPNSYTSADEGKVVSSGELTKTANGTYDTTLNDEVVVEVPNTYTSADEGKVVSSGELVSQTSTTKTANGTYDTTLNDEVIVEVPNTYTNADEGKVVSSGALVSQTSTSVTANGTYDTTLNNEVVVNVSGSGFDVAGLIDRSIQSANIPSGATSIGSGAFQDCVNLASVTIPSGVTSIGSNAFARCTSLTSIIVPEGVTSVGASAFYYNEAYTPQFEIDLPSTVTDIGGYCFRNIRNLILYVRAITPPTLGSSALDGVTGTPHIYVPSASVEAYKTASGWSAKAANIEAIPTP